MNDAIREPILDFRRSAEGCRRLAASIVLSADPARGRLERLPAEYDAQASALERDRPKQPKLN